MATKWPGSLHSRAGKSVQNGAFETYSVEVGYEKDSIFPF